MSTFTQSMFHIVFATKHRARVLCEDKREELFKYIWGINKRRNCHLYRINGVEDHLHILTALHPTMNPADYVKEVKVATSRWIRKNKIFEEFDGWQDGYGAFTHFITDKERLVRYIMNQEEHHRQKSFREELIELLEEAGIDYDPEHLP